jgi:rhodanese-related sulfurtransferase
MFRKNGKNMKNIFAILMAISIVFLGCGEKKTNLYLVNVLEKELFDDAHIPGSINVPYQDLIKQSSGWDKNAEIILYCSNTMCLASGEGVKQLKALGFKNVRAYEDGIAGWVQAGHDVVGNHQADYLKYKTGQESVASDEVISTNQLKDLLKKNKFIK